MEGSLAQKRRELGQLETQQLSAHQVAHDLLEEDRQGLAEREQRLALKEKELQLRDEQRLQAEQDLATPREGDLAQALS